MLTERQKSALETVVNFLETFYEEFQVHLDHNLEIESTEAEWMVEELKGLLPEAITGIAARHPIPSPHGFIEKD